MIKESTCTGSMMVSERPNLLLSAARWIASALNSLAHFIPMLLVRPFSLEAAWRVYRHWGRYTCRIFGIDVALRDDNAGELPAGPRLYVWLNQSSLAESVAFVQLLPRWNTICNVEYALMPILGWGLALLNNVVIIRQWKWQAKAGVERAAKRLARGEKWLISIEGARTPDGSLQPYKKGAVVLALRSQATIVPMFIRGAREVMPHGEWRVRPGRVTVHLLKAISTEGLSYADRGAMMEQLRALAEREMKSIGE
jgi:1-acyl-sn-glycerol-3-phosphate acyltransferase